MSLFDDGCCATRVGMRSRDPEAATKTLYRLRREISGDVNMTTPRVIRGYEYLVTAIDHEVVADLRFCMPFRQLAKLAEV